VRAAAWPLIRDDLGLSYAEIGLALAIPGLLGSALEPMVGILGDTPRRRAVVVGSGAVFTLSVALTAGATGFWTLLIALAVGNPAASGFVSLSQAALMDFSPVRRERLMAWWTLAGSLGYVGGPLLLAVALALGAGWRGALLILVLGAAVLTAAARRVPDPPRVSPVRVALRGVVSALRERDVVRWLVVLKAADLLLDVFLGFLALYLVDVAGTSPGAAGLAVAVWTGAGLLGDAALIPMLGLVSGRTYLRVSAVVAAPAYASFLLVDGFDFKLVLLAVLGFANAGWYAIPKAALYEALPGRSGTAVAVSGFAGLAHSGIPALLGAAAGAFGLAAVMWALILAPAAIVVLVPRR
jgi:MFS transporter, FSR family, fosmidomycin resistance protein